jgi:hypothetical protein
VDSSRAFGETDRKDFGLLILIRLRHWRLHIAFVTPSEFRFFPRYLNIGVGGSPSS